MNDNQTQLIYEARQQALEILHACATPQGFRASADRIGYPQIWGRDSIMTFVGAVASGDADLIAAGRASLQTLGEFQSPLGLIPLNVNPDNGFISSENAGAVDSNLYFILGHYLQYQISQDTTFLKESWPHIERAMTW